MEQENSGLDPFVRSNSYWSVLRSEDEEFSECATLDTRLLTAFR